MVKTEVGDEPEQESDTEHFQDVDEEVPGTTSSDRDWVLSQRNLQKNRLEVQHSVTEVIAAERGDTISAESMRTETALSREADLHGQHESLQKTSMIASLKDARRMDASLTRRTSEWTRQRCNPSKESIGFW